MSHLKLVTNDFLNKKHQNETFKVANGELFVNIFPVRCKNIKDTFLAEFLLISYFFYIYF